MKLIQNGKLFGKINLLDFIVGIILLVLLIGGFYKLVLVDNTVYMPEYSDGIITVKLQSLSEFEVEAIAVGDKVSVPKIQALGTVSALVPSARVDSVSSIDGKVYPVENPLIYELTVTIDANELVKRDDSYFVGKNFKVVSGQSLDVTNGFLNAKATVLSIEMKS